MGESDGEIKVNRTIDRERNPSFTLIITASNKVPLDPSVPSTKSTTKVFITIDDLNDNAPNITTIQNNVYIEENSPKNTFVIDVDAVDKDIGMNSEIEVC